MEGVENTLIVDTPTVLRMKLVPPYFSRSYGVLLTFSNNPEDIALRYETYISYLKTVNGDIRLFKIERTGQVYINDYLPENVADQLAYEVGKVFYPLIIEVGFDGAYLGVHNTVEIKERWPQVKLDVLSYFSGEEVDQYLLETEQIITDEFALDICFENDFFINTFFSPIYQNYGTDRTLIAKRSFSLMPQMPPVELTINSELATQTNDYGAIELKLKGTGILNEEQPFCNATFEARFILDKQTQSIEALLANYKWEDNDRQEVEIRIFRIDEQPTHRTEQSDRESSLVFLDPVEKKDKWAFLKKLF
jgi:hypothetical protein